MENTPSERKLAAIIFADIVGYTALMQRGEEHAMQLLDRFSAVTRSKSEWYNGEIVKTYGDCALMIFQSAEA